MKKTGFGKSALIASVIALTLMTEACKDKKTAKADSKDEEESVFAVNGYMTKPGNMDEYLEFGGDVSSVSAVDIFPDVGGKIQRILVNVGDNVKKDEIIAYVDASRPGMNYSASPVKSPITGRITAFPPTIGTMVSQGYSVAQVSDTDELQIKINVAERFISRISNGQKAVINFDAYPGVNFDAKVFEVSPVLDISSRTMQVKLKIDHKDPRIRVGMYARVKLITDSVKEAIIVPSNAVISRDGEPHVFVIKDIDNESKTHARLTPVTKGISVDGKTEISGGITDGQIIVIKGQSLLSDNARVKVLSVQNKQD